MMRCSSSQAQKAPVRPVIAATGSGSIDCHAHVFDPDRFPYAPEATYRPTGQEVGTAEAYVGVFDGLAAFNKPLTAVPPAENTLSDQLGRRRVDLEDIDEFKTLVDEVRQ